MSLIITFMLIFLLLVIVNASKYDPEVIEGLGFNENTLSNLNLLPSNRIGKHCKRVGENDDKAPLENMGANADFGSPNKIFRDTDKLMIDLRTEARMLAKDTRDNDIEEKYIYSLMEYFHLEFIKINFNVDPKEQDNIPNFYEKAFETALANTKKQRDSNAMQLAAPVRRVSSILGSVLGTLVEIIQTTCTKDLLDWQCAARYYVILEKETYNCPDLWYHHHEVFVETLKLVQKNQKTLLDVTKDVMASVDYMTAFRIYNTETNPQKNGLFGIDYVNDYNAYLEESMHQNPQIDRNNAAKYASNIEDYRDRLVNINSEESKGPLNKMRYHDFRTSKGPNTSYKEINNIVRNSDAVYQHNTHDNIKHRETFHEVEAQRKQKDTKFTTLINSVLIRNIPLFTKENPIQEPPKQNRKNESGLQRENESNRRTATINLTEGSKQESRQNNAIPSIFDDRDDSDVDYEDIHRRGILFDSTMKFLYLYRNVLKEYLITKARVYKLVATYQDQDKLNCIMIKKKPVVTLIVNQDTSKTYR